MATVLVVDDEPPIRQMLKLALTRGGFEVVEAETALKALDEINRNKTIDLVLLDWMLPDMSGTSLLTQLRQSSTYKLLPVIMVTAKAEENNVLRGFSMGADDYITKPFSPKELIARVQAVLKRSHKPKPKLLSFKTLSFDLEGKRLMHEGKQVKCGRLEFNLLVYFVQNLNRTLSREHLLDKVWPAQKDVTERTVDVHVRRIRQILEAFEYQDYIRSVRGEGYQMLEEL